MVDIGHDRIERVHYEPPAGVGGLEIVTWVELRRRMSPRLGTRAAERPEFHLLLTVERGVVQHMVDFHDYALTDGEWLWVRPGQVQRFGEPTAATGWAVLFQPEFLDPTTAAETRLDDTFRQTFWPVAGQDRDAVQKALRHLTDEYQAPELSGVTRGAIGRHLLAVLLLRLAHIGPTAASEEQGEAFLRFRAAVESGFAENRGVGHYARTLGYSPRTLTRATVAAAGVGAKEFIDRRVMLEAKRLLAHGQEPVATVASRLGFPDASNFVKYFSQRAGATPAAFRAQFGGRA